MPDERDITTLLHAHAAGEPDALAMLLPRVYDELRRIAAGRLRRERPGHTLSPTEVVHEAFLKLVPLPTDVRHRAHFYAIASRAMRNVLVDHAERRRALKRGGGRIPVTLDDAVAVGAVAGGGGVAARGTVAGDAAAGGAVAGGEAALDDLIALGRALARLEQLDERQARVVECRFFGGLSLDETAEALGISAATVSRDWTFARAWLQRELSGAA